MGLFTSVFPWPLRLQQAPASRRKSHPKVQPKLEDCPTKMRSPACPASQTGRNPHHTCWRLACPQNPFVHACLPAAQILRPCQACPATRREGRSTWLGQPASAPGVPLCPRVLLHVACGEQLRVTRLLQSWHPLPASPCPCLTAFIRTLDAPAVWMTTVCIKTRTALERSSHGHKPWLFISPGRSSAQACEPKVLNCKSGSNFPTYTTASNAPTSQLEQETPPFLHACTCSSACQGGNVECCTESAAQAWPAAQRTAPGPQPGPACDLRPRQGRPAAPCSRPGHARTAACRASASATASHQPKTQKVASSRAGPVAKVLWDHAAYCAWASAMTCLAPTSSSAYRMRSMVFSTYMRTSHLTRVPLELADGTDTSGFATSTHV